MASARDADVPTRDLARAARVLAIRTRREASGLFAGSYASAFRGGGMEFDESRPYAPGDDVRNFDWNALARTGEPYVKRYREERDQLLLLALDGSASMRFGTTGRSKAATAAHAAALLAAAAGRAGDRLGLLVFDTEIRASIRPARGAGHTWHAIRTAVTSAASPSGPTRLSAVAEEVLAQGGHRRVVVILSDFRERERDSLAEASFHALCRRHDVVSIVLHDPREESLAPVGLVRLEDPEHPGHTFLLDARSTRARALYRRAFALRSRVLERRLRGLGSDVLWLRTDRDPLRSLVRFFAQRAARSRTAA